MSAVLFITSNVASFSLGALMWRWITLREARAFSEKGDQMDDTQGHGAPAAGPPPHRRTVPLFRVIIVGLFAGSLILIGFGVQQHRYQKAETHYQSCVNDWGTDLVSAVRTSRTASKGLSRATSARDSARAAWESDVGSIILTFAALQAQPPTAQVADISRLLTGFPPINARLIRAQTLVDRETRRVRSAQDANPIPALHCKP